MLEVAERGDPGRGELVHPAIVDESDRDGVQEMQLLAPLPPGHDQARLFQQLQMLHHPETRHRQPLFESAQGLPVRLEQLVQQLPRVGSASALNTSSMGERYVTI